MRFVTRANATLAYLALVLILGGASAAGYAANFALQLLGAGLIAWTVADSSGDAPVATGLRRFAIILAVLALVQFVPLPPGLWEILPGRGPVEHGFAVLGAEAGWMTLSLAPWSSLLSLAWWIPALAVFLAVRAPHAPSTRSLVLTVAAVASVAVVLGFMQRTGGAAYIYRITNFGAGTGFFANSNHQGALMLATLSLWTGYFVSEQGSRPRRPARGIPLTVLAPVGLLFLFGVLLSNSLAVLGLLVPTFAALVLIARPSWRVPPLALIVPGAVVVLIMIGLIAFPIGDAVGLQSGASWASRRAYLLTGLGPMIDYAPFGSGLGTFMEIYRQYEPDATISTVYANHAHNDLLEVLIETGVFGLAAIVVFFDWFLPRAWKLWTGDRNRPVALAASVVIGVLLAHSIVDYPLRTAALSAIMALACVLLVREEETREQRRPSPERQATGQHQLIRI